MYISAPRSKTLLLLKQEIIFSARWTITVANGLIEKNLIHNRDCLELFPDFDVIFGLTYWIFTTLNMWLHQELLTTYISVRWVLEFADIEISQILYTEVTVMVIRVVKFSKGFV